MFRKVSLDLWILLLILLEITSEALSFEGEGTRWKSEMRLRQRIFNASVYDEHVLPCKDLAHGPVRVNIGLRLTHIDDLSEQEGRLSAECYIYLVWNDPRLTWNPANYSDIKKITIGSNSIWQPDIQLFNSIRGSHLETLGRGDAILQWNGMVSWTRLAAINSVCNLDLKLYPYDVQTCLLKFASWNYDGDQVDLELMNVLPEVHGNLFSVISGQWELLSTVMTKNVSFQSCCPEPYPDITVTVKLRRRAPYYKFTILYPTLAVVFLTLVTFLLPPSSTQKLTIGLFNLLILVILLMHLSWKLPPTGRNAPMIAWFCGHSVIVVTISIVLSAIFVMWSRGRHTGKPPRFLKVMLHSWIGRLLCVAPPTLPANSNYSDPAAIDLDGFDNATQSEYTREHYNHQEWTQCITLLDRINFFVFAVIFTLVLAGALNY